MKHISFFKHLLVAAIILLCSATAASTESNEINRYKIDFHYYGIGYQILSQENRTVAVCQDYDIDGPCSPHQTVDPAPYRNPTGPNGFIHPSLTIIPSVVYDPDGVAYTVTDLAHWAINYELFLALVLPPTLERLNGGISAMPYLKYLYLPSGLKELRGILFCEQLESLIIPSSVESVTDHSLSSNGYKSIYLPPLLKTLGSDVLSDCDNLQTAIISAVETMGEGCFANCNSLEWANLPETLQAMGDGCFNNNPALTRVSLPWSQIQMNNCFNGCSAINCIELLALDPYPFPENCFVDVDRSNCDLLVQSASLEKYMQAPGWKDFVRINGIPTGSGVEAAESLSPQFVAVPGIGSITISNPNSEQITISTANGQIAATTSSYGNSTIPLPAGVYVVSSDTQSRKIIVK